MIVFAKDLGTDEGESKYDMLAVAVARNIQGEEVKFAKPGVHGKVAVSQFGDGKVLLECGDKNVFLFHDWFDKYEKYLDKCQKAIFLGNFGHPDIKNAVKLSSYPVETVRELPKDTDCPVLVTGEYDSRCLDWLLDRISSLGDTALRISCYNVMKNFTETMCPEYFELIDKVSNLVGDRDLVESNSHAPMCLLAAYMGAATHILHCGGNRGMVHAMAVSTGRCESFTGDDKFTPAKINELIVRLIPLLR